MQNSIQDKIYRKCWGNIQSKVRTQIHIPKNELQTERQWAKQGYVVDRPSAEYGCKIKDTAVIIDLMPIFAEIYGERSEYYDGYKWQKLITCASYYGYEWHGNAHDSLADCLATLYCYEQIKKSSQLE